MREELVDLLLCPRCRGNLGATARERRGEEIWSGSLQCDQGHTYAITRAVPRFVAGDDYVSNFSFEWNRHRTTQLDSANGSRESEERFAESLPFPLAELKGKLVLDVGCGMGRFAEIVLKYGGSVVGIDLSFAVDAAYTNLGANPRASFAQANIFELPFKDGSFDLIYSLGVLHHTPDPRRAFGLLPRLLKPGGTIMLTLYSANNKAYVAASEFWRRLTTRLPGSVLYKLAHISIPLYYIWRLPKIGKVFSTLFPISLHPRPEWRVLDTYDWYSPRYQFYYTHPEVFRWFEEEGLREIKVRGPGISLAGQRPDTQRQV